MQVKANIRGNQVKVVLNAEDFDKLVAGDEIVGYEDNDPTDANNTSVKIILEDIGYDKMRAAVDRPRA